jgi:hypothetical protein
MAASTQLLKRFKPQVIYDHQEQYFSDSAAEWTDTPGNQLIRGDRKTVVAAAGGAGGHPTLSLALLSDTTYGANGKPWEDGDYIGRPKKDYAKVYSRLHQNPLYRNRVYGRAVPAESPRWLQYWFFYFYNDAPAQALGIGYGKHEGDWEMVQLRLSDDGFPDRAIYAQHKHAEVRPWPDVPKAANGTAPLVYVARASHAAYFQTVHLPWERADGGLPSPPLVLEDITDGDTQPTWVKWPGTWGDTQKPGHGIGESSPGAPCHHKQWQHPEVLLEEPGEKATPERPVRALPPSLETMSVSRSNGRAEVSFAFPGGSRGTATSLLVTTMSLDDKVPPATHTIPVGADTLSVVAPGKLDERKRYQVTVSAMNEDGGITSALTRNLWPEGAE